MKSPFSDLDGASITLHEMFSSYVRAGFTRQEALELTKVTIAEQVKYAISKTIKDEENNGG